MAVSLSRPAASTLSISGESGRARAESRDRSGEPDLARPLAAVDDRKARWLGIPGFGIAIPRLTPLLDDVALHDPAYWFGSLYFVGLATAIWQGNRWLLFEQRRHYGWFDHPVRKLVFLLGAIVLYTAPLTVAALSAWYGYLGRPADIDAIRTVALMNVICVVFVTHAYETVFLIKEREHDLVRVAQLDRARAEAELSAFLAQVDPHFLFNSLNTLGHLIDTDQASARRFTDDLAAVYRYVLAQRGRTLVPLADELTFTRAYIELARIRYGSALDFAVTLAPGFRIERWSLPPTALQLLVENAIKHNRVGADSPLRIDVELRDGAMSVCNRVAPRRRPAAGAGVGLHNLDERSRLVSGHGIAVATESGTFRVDVPLGEVSL